MTPAPIPVSSQGAHRRKAVRLIRRAVGGAIMLSGALIFAAELIAAPGLGSLLAGAARASGAP